MHEPSPRETGERDRGKESTPHWQQQAGLFTASRWIQFPPGRDLLTIITFISFAGHRDAARPLGEGMDLCKHVDYYL